MWFGARINLSLWGLWLLGRMNSKDGELLVLFWYQLTPMKICLAFKCSQMTFMKFSSGVSMVYTAILNLGEMQNIINNNPPEYNTPEIIYAWNNENKKKTNSTSGFLAISLQIFSGYSISFCQGTHLIKAVNSFCCKISPAFSLVYKIKHNFLN